MSTDLSRNEEMILLAIWRLENEAYGVTIRRQVMEITRRALHYGSMYNTLDLLIRKDLVRVERSAPRAVRGGRSRKLYQLTRSGKLAMQALREIQRDAWKGIPDYAFKID